MHRKDRWMKRKIMNYKRQRGRDGWNVNLEASSSRTGKLNLHREPRTRGRSIQFNQSQWYRIA
jgi:hypothetical protein